MPASWLYSLGWQAYLATYKLGIKRPAAPHRPIICVGSLTSGGSGKTPLALHLAEVLSGLKREVVIGCSGYGSPSAAGARLAPDGGLKAAQWGDEPAMIRWLAPNVPIVVGRDRVLAAQQTHERYPHAVLVMDDGFQHLPLAKQLTVVVADPEAGNKNCLPAGPFREPYRNRRRADIVVPDDLTVVRQPMKIVDTEGRMVVPAEYSVLCALARPSQFERGLAAAFPNASPAPTRLFLPDHDPMTAPELFDALQAETPIVVTAKDWVKLRDRIDILRRQILIALQEVELEPKDKLIGWVRKAIEL